MAWVAYSAPKKERTHWLDTGLWVLLGLLIGARAGFTIFNWDYFQAHLSELPQVWLGGLSWPGAVAGGLMTLAGLAIMRKESPGVLADEMVALTLPLTVAAWLAAWEAGVAYGHPVENTWWAVPTLDEWGNWIPRWPLQPAGATICLAIFWLVGLLRPYLKQPGEAASLVLTGISLTLFGLSFYRADPVQTWQGWRLDTWAGLFFVIIALLACLVTFWPRKFKGKSIV